MTQAQTQPQLYTFDEFINGYPENSDVRYELHDGVIIEMPKPKGKHSTFKLIVEVVSTNWRDDYYNKLRDYEEMGIEEYWIVDYAALGLRKLIGTPKQPTFFVNTLVEGEYLMTPFTENTPIVSPTFPLFNFYPQQVFSLSFR